MEASNKEGRRAMEDREEGEGDGGKDMNQRDHYAEEESGRELPLRGGEDNSCRGFVFLFVLTGMFNFENDIDSCFFGVLKENPTHTNAGGRKLFLVTHRL